MSTIVKGACHHDCPDTCVWEVTVDQGVAVKLRGSDEHPTTRGELCPKVNRFLDRVYHPDRILTPLRRTGPKGDPGFEPISWPEALSEIADRLGDSVTRHGGQSILQYSFDGTQGLIQKGVMADRFFDAVGASDIKRHLCGVTAWLGASDVSGVPYGIDPEDLRHARSIILWGTNTLLTNRHLWPIIEEARTAGCQVTVIDPIRTATAARADQFVQLRPGTDVALVLAMIHVIMAEGHVDHEWIQTNTVDADALFESAQKMPPELAAGITGVGADEIHALALRFATTTPSAIRALVGPEHREHGRDIMRAIALLPAVTGAWRHRGGGLARSTQVYFEQALNLPADRPDRRSFNMAELGQVLTNEQLDPPITALVVHNSNPAVICPDQNAVLRGLERDDLFTVVIEQFETDTARYADIVLPATTQLEHLDLAIAWGHLYLALNEPAIAPVGQSLPNTEIFRRLAVAMGLDDPGFADSDQELIDQLLASDHAWLGGIRQTELAASTWTRLRVSDGHRPYVDSVADTPSGKLTLGSLTYRAGTETPDGDPEHARRYPLTLLSRKQHTKFLNANYGGFERHLPTPNEPRVELHIDDARARSIAEGDQVQLFNDRGTLTLRATISEAVQPGVVAMPFGWWLRHTPEARAVNALTNAASPRGGGSAYFHETLVEVAVAPDQQSVLKTDDLGH